MNNLLYFTTDVVNLSSSLSLVKTSFLTAAVFAAFVTSATNLIIAIINESRLN